MSASSSDLAPLGPDAAWEVFVPPVEPQAPTGRPLRCHVDALTLARARPELTIVAGYGLADVAWEGHFWLVDEHAKVIDPYPYETEWRPRVYVGVRIPTAEAERLHAEHGSRWWRLVGIRPSPELEEALYRLAPAF